VAVLALLAPGCMFSRPTSEVLEKVDALPARPSYLRVKNKVSLTSGWMSGRFTGVMAIRGGESPAVRLQCFPDLGGKALDVLATPARMAGVVVQLNQGCDLAMPTSETPNPVTMMGASMLEFHAPVTRDRVLGQRAADGGWWLALKPVVAGVRIMVWLGPDGRITKKRVYWNGAGWDEGWETDDVYVFKAPGVEMRVEQAEAKVVDSLPASLFELTVPPGVKPIESPKPK